MGINEVPAHKKCPSASYHAIDLATFIFENVQKSTICVHRPTHIGGGEKGDRTLCLVIELYFTHKIYLFMIWRSEAKARKSNLNSFATQPGLSGNVKIAKATVC